MRIAGITAFDKSPLLRGEPAVKVYEEFFPGYGSSWASYHGGVGILYEMSRTSGTLIRKREGTVRTFAQAVEHQTTSSLANVTSLADNAAEILADMVAAREGVH